MDLKKEAEAIKETIIEYRRHIHMNPELGFEEFETSKFIQSKLKELGVEFKTYAKTGVVGTIRGSADGKRIMIRADMDALPVHEVNEVAYKSKIDGKMHACGHDTHVACLLGAAKLLKQNASEFKGIVDVLFQPAEEGPGGATPMIKEGAIGDPDKPHIDAAISLHVYNENRWGMIALKDGTISGSADELYITVQGRGGHASEPHMTIDPVYIAMQIGVAIQGWLSRTTDPVEPKVITIGKIVGGDRNNIISDTCKMDGTLRTLNEEVREDILSRLPEFVDSIARSFGGRAELEIVRGYAVGINDKNLNDHFRKVYAEMYGDEGIHEFPNPMLGAEDFYDFSLKGKIPVSMIMLDGYDKEQGMIHPNHHSKFDVNENCLPIGSATLAGTAISFLNED
ncbi:MAG: amidohydrolase [Candidatus Heimdallarchaeota archaeon]|nr:amidohydrolase [Candidatus Heimdallarchaeota archaeon]